MFERVCLGVEASPGFPYPPACLPGLTACSCPTDPTPLTPAQPHSEEAAEKREAATSTEDLNQDVVGGNIPRTLLKLLTYCRVSDKATCEILLELGKVKVNGEVCDDPVKLVRSA